MICVHLTISGFVQGVGFRYFVKGKANELGLAGWVKNTSDGKVEVLAQGDEGKVKKLVEECRKGPFLAKVSNVEQSVVKATGEMKDFVVEP